MIHPLSTFSICLQVGLSGDLTWVYRLITGCWFYCNDVERTFSPDQYNRLRYFNATPLNLSTPTTFANQIVGSAASFRTFCDLFCGRSSGFAGFSLASCLAPNPTTLLQHYEVLELCSWALYRSQTLSCCLFLRERKACRNLRNDWPEKDFFSGQTQADSSWGRVGEQERPVPVADAQQHKPRR